MSRVIKNYNAIIDYDNKINIIVPQIEIMQTENVEEDIAEEQIDTIEMAEKTAERIIATAKASARNIIDEAQFEKEILFQTTRQKAVEDLEADKEKVLKDAYDEGFEKGRLEAKHLKDEAEEILINAKHTYEETMDNMEPEMVNLVISICKKLIKDAMTIKPEIVKYLIQEGLSKTTLSGEIFIHASSYDYEYVYEHKDEFMKVDSKTKIEIINDPTLSKGDILIETPFGNIDSSITNQFAELSEDLLYLLENR